MTFFLEHNKLALYITSFVFIYLFIYFPTQFLDYQLNVFLIVCFPACGGRFQGPQGQIQSPNWPGFYPSSKTCDYLIQVNASQTVSFQFTAVELGEDLDCTFNFIEVLHQIIKRFYIYKQSGYSFLEEKGGGEGGERERERE